MKIYLVARCYGSDSSDGCGDGPEKYGPPEAAFASWDEACEYAGPSGRAVIDLEVPWLPEHEESPHRGHELAREIIAKHGVNRYPTADRSLLKLMEEVGELTQAYLRDGTADLARVRKEYADAGLVLYALGDALGLDLEAEMRAVVDGETRRFG